MPRTKLLVSALTLALAGVTSAQAQTFSNVITFGDSLSDAGQYVGLVPGAQGSFTTNPDPVAAQLIAGYFLGIDPNAYTASNFGGWNFAYGGAQTANPFSTGPFAGNPFCVTGIPTGLPCRSMTTQLANYYARSGGRADPNTLYSVWGGGNDLFFTLFRAGLPSVHPLFISSAQAQANMQTSAINELGIIASLQATGARYILVYNLPDVGRSPDGIASGAGSSISGLVSVFNGTLNAGLATLGDGIIPINTFGLINEVMADPSAYGLSNVTGRACVPATSVVFCSTSTLVAPGANNTYLFADGSHPSGAAHRLLASVVIATVSAPGQVSMAAELPLQVYDNHSSVINQQIFGMNRAPRSAGESNVYGQLRYSRQDFNTTANTGAFDNDLLTGTFGADVRYNDAISLGASATVGGSEGDSGGSSIDATEVLVSAYGIAHFGSGYLSAIASGGSSRFDINRNIVLGPTTRVEEGNTSASHVAFEIGGGFAFGSDDFRHGPFASITWQKIDVDGYVEDSLDSTSMWFGDFNRKSTVGRVGYQAQGNAGRLQPFGRVAWARETQDRVASIQAGSNTLNGRFTMDGFVHAEDWMEADVGLNYAFNDATDISVSYRARLSDDTQDGHSIGLGFRTEFGGGAPAPAPEPVVVVRTTCADLDDDGDGVNNCNDKCPGSTAGEAIGPDGCPVPAPEPEPVMEPKPFRN